MGAAVWFQESKGIFSSKFGPSYFSFLKESTSTIRTRALARTPSLAIPPTHSLNSTSLQLPIKLDGNSRKIKHQLDMHAVPILFLRP